MSRKNTTTQNTCPAESVRQQGNLPVAKSTEAPAAQLQARVHQKICSTSSMSSRHSGQGWPGAKLGAQSLQMHLCALVPCLSAISFRPVMQMTHRFSSSSLSSSVAGPLRADRCRRCCCRSGSAAEEPGAGEAPPAAPAATGDGDARELGLPAPSGGSGAGGGALLPAAAGGFRPAPACGRKGLPLLLAAAAASSPSVGGADGAPSLSAVVRPRLPSSALGSCCCCCCCCGAPGCAGGRGYSLVPPPPIQLLRRAAKSSSLSPASTQQGRRRARLVGWRWGVG